MRDPFQWAVPVFRAFGIPVKLHVTLFLFTLGMFLRQVTQPGASDKVLAIFLLTIPVLFTLILLHEFGHCFAARLQDGEAKEIILWPLGGLANVEFPHDWRSHTIVALGGPIVNVVVCLIGFIILAGAGFFPTVNPIANPYTCEMKNYRDSRTYTSEYGLRLYEPKTADEVKPTEDMLSKLAKPEELHEAVVKSGWDRAVAPIGLVWVNRIFWLSWVLLLLNALPGFPLDGGQVLMGLIWSKSDREQGLTTAAYAGYVVAAILVIASFASNETWPMALALFIAVACWLKTSDKEETETSYGDFSAGYSSLEGDDEPAPRPRKKQTFMKRWMTARTARRLQRENEEQIRDELRLDQLLEKIARKEVLTAEEQAFMKRVSTRYKNR
jgi:Zn-dependent protease